MSYEFSEIFQEHLCCTTSVNSYSRCFRNQFKNFIRSFPFIISLATLYLLGCYTITSTTAKNYCFLILHFLQTILIHCISDFFAKLIYLDIRSTVFLSIIHFSQMFFFLYITKFYFKKYLFF